VKKKNRTLYIFVAVLVILGLAGGIVLSAGGPISKKSEDEASKQTSEEQAEESQNQSSKEVFKIGKSTGGQEGQYYYISGFSFKKSGDFDRITITFQGRGTDSKLPFYTVEPGELSLIITFSDTTDFDISAGQSTFDSEKNITCDGFVVKSIALSYPKADNTIAVAIETNTSEFGYLVSEQDLKLVVDIK